MKSLSCWYTDIIVLQIGILPIYNQHHNHGDSYDSFWSQFLGRRFPYSAEKGLHRGCNDMILSIDNNFLKNLKARLVFIEDPLQMSYIVNDKIREFWLNDPKVRQHITKQNCES